MTNNFNTHVAKKAIKDLRATKNASISTINLIIRYIEELKLEEESLELLEQENASTDAERNAFINANLTMFNDITCFVSGRLCSLDWSLNQELKC